MAKIFSSRKDGVIKRSAEMLAAMVGTPRRIMLLVGSASFVLTLILFYR
jgi:hypothetical protein